MRRQVDVLAGDVTQSTVTRATRQSVEVTRKAGASNGALVRTVPTGTTGWDQQPDGTLWVEYNPA